ncbi:hypothetical protein [Chitinophaga polysaccharea]|uniref:hypothetical protein n=1 Tax=Chitinophaga polysaccharea TaxID=1293035 RepID=UPI00115A1201|nr:hypothetical protein [Chitinophaga polysaccharea]
MRSSLSYPLITLLLGTALLLLITAPGCQCKKDNTITPPPQPEPPKDIYLVTAIRVNNVPKDSLVYNDQHQVTERWDYNPSYRIWQSYIVYQYNQEGYLSIAKYYNENDNTVKSLSQKDSLVWKPAQLVTYTTFYRELGTEISGYDTAYMQITPDRLLTLEGSTDTLVLDGIPAIAVIYRQYRYQGKDVNQFTDMNYFLVRYGSPNLTMSRFDLAYSQLNNPLFAQVAKNPNLFRAIVNDNYPFFSNEFYPYLISEHLVTNIRYESEQIAPKNCPVTYKMYDTTNFPQTQTIAGLNKTLSYTYKVIKAD